MVWYGMEECGSLIHISLTPIYGTMANSVEEDQMPKSAASDQVLQFLLTESTF